MISHLSLLVFLAHSTGFRDLLLEELEPLLDVLEIRKEQPGPLSANLTGHSIIYKGRLQHLGGDPLTSGDLIVHSLDKRGQSQTVAAVLEPTTLLYFPSYGMERLLRNEPELGMLLLEQLRGENRE